MWFMYQLWRTPAEWKQKGWNFFLQKYHDITIDMLTTDRHVQVRAFLKKEYLQIVHQFDLWHFGKSLKKKLTAAAKKKTNAELSP